MEPQCAICSAFLLFTFEKRDRIGIQALCRWALEDALSLQLLFDSLKFLHSSFGLREGRLEKCDDNFNKSCDLFVWVLSECCSQIVSKNLTEELDSILSFLCECSERFNLNEVEHPIFLRGNSHVIASMCSRAIDTTTKGLKEVESFLRELWRFNESYGREKCFEKLCLVCSFLVEEAVESWLPRNQISSTQLKAVKLFEQTTKAVLTGDLNQQNASDRLIFNSCTRSMDALREQVVTIVVEKGAAVVPNLLLSRRAFGEVSSALIRKEWDPHLREILDEMNLMPGIKDTNPLLDQFLQKGVKKTKKKYHSMRVFRPRSFTSPSKTTAALGAHSKTLTKGEKLAAEVFLSWNSLIQELVVIQKFVWNHQLSLTARLSNPSPQLVQRTEEFADLSKSIKNMIDIYTSFLRDLEVKNITKDSLSTFLNLLLEAGTAYVEQLVQSTKPLLSGGVEMDLHGSMAQATHNTIFSGKPFGEVLSYPILNTIPSALNLVERLNINVSESVEALKLLLSSKNATRLSLFGLDRSFSSTGAESLTQSSSKVVLKEDHLRLVQLTEHTMVCVPAVLYILKTPASIICGTKDEELSLKRKELVYNLVFVAHSVETVEDVQDNIALSNALVVTLRDQNKVVLKSSNKTKIMAKISKHFEKKN